MSKSKTKGSHNRQYYYSEWPPYMLKDNYIAKSRRDYKRLVKRSRRRLAKQELLKEVY